MDKKVTVCVDIETDKLGSYTDEYLATCWHVAQANPAPIEDEKASELVEEIGREIIRRWLQRTGPELYRHQGRDYFWNILSKNGNWGEDGEWHPNQPLPEPPAAEKK